jgi:hypothetical protein
MKKKVIKKNIKIISSSQQSKITGGNKEASLPGGCACCICMPDTSSAGAHTANGT